MTDDNVIQVDFSKKKSNYNLNDAYVITPEGTVTFTFGDGKEFVTELPDLSKQDWTKFFSMQAEGMFDNTFLSDTVTITVDKPDEQTVYTLVPPEDK